MRIGVIAQFRAGIEPHVEYLTQLLRRHIAATPFVYKAGYGNPLRDERLK